MFEGGDDIDWGADPVAVNEIDYSISLEDSGIKVEGGGLAGGVAKNDQALTILDAPSYREQFLDELFEVIQLSMDVQVKFVFHGSAIFHFTVGSLCQNAFIRTEFVGEFQFIFID